MKRLSGRCATVASRPGPRPPQHITARFGGLLSLPRTVFDRRLGQPAVAENRPPTLTIQEGCERGVNAVKRRSAASIRRRIAARDALASIRPAAMCFLKLAQLLRQRPRGRACSRVREPSVGSSAGAPLLRLTRERSGRPRTTPRLPAYAVPAVCVLRASLGRSWS